MSIEGRGDPQAVVDRLERVLVEMGFEVVSRDKAMYALSAEGTRQGGARELRFRVAVFESPGTRQGACWGGTQGSLLCRG